MVQVDVWMARSVVKIWTMNSLSSLMNWIEGDGLKTLNEWKEYIRYQYWNMGKSNTYTKWLRRNLIASDCDSLTKETVGDAFQNVFWRWCLTVLLWCSMVSWTFTLHWESVHAWILPISDWWKSQSQVDGVSLGYKRTTDRKSGYADSVTMK